MLSEITYALIVSVEDYNQSDDFPKVDYASKDADEIYEALVLSSVVEEDNIRRLKSHEATQASIKTELEKLIRHPTSNDKILFFFVGHGAYVNGTNWILPVDSYKSNINNTGISIEYILQSFKKSVTKKCILFLDCCHSGFEPESGIRDIDDAFMTDELLLKYKDEEYCCGFASSKSDEKSISHISLKNGVWSHYLIKALKGEANGYYKGGILFSNDLQSYLNKNVSTFVPKHSTKRRKQTPVMFGNITDKFIVADLNTLFEEKIRLASIEGSTFKAVTLLSQEDDSIKSLPGFVRGSHTVPKTFFPEANNFIARIGEDLIKDEINEIRTEVKKAYNYKRTDIEVAVEDGMGSIVTPDFSYSMEILQSKEDASEYVLLRRLEEFDKSNIVTSNEFNEIFEGLFQKLEFRLDKTLNIEELVDKVEDMLENDSISIDYDDLNMNSCSIKFNNFEYEIFVTQNSIAFQTVYKTTPVKLIEAYKNMKQVLLENSSLNLLS
jgi:hypothetical protein